MSKILPGKPFILSVALILTVVCFTVATPRASAHSLQSSEAHPLAMGTKVRCQNSDGTYDKTLTDQFVYDAYTFEYHIYGRYYCTSGAFAHKVEATLSLWQSSYQLGGDFEGCLFIQNGSSGPCSGYVRVSNAGSGGQVTTVYTGLWYVNCTAAGGRIYPGGNPPVVDSWNGQNVCG